jgi:hypothetical protein
MNSLSTHTRHLQHPVNVGIEDRERLSLKLPAIVMVIVMAIVMANLVKAVIQIDKSEQQEGQGNDG